MTNTMGERIKLARVAANMTTKDLERLTDIDRSTWGNVESGRQRTNEDHLKALQKIMPMYIYWIVTGETLSACGQTQPNINNAEKKHNAA